jgi:hypothetical protein
VLQCTKCGGSQSCLFELLVPHSVHSPEYTGRLVATYLSEEKSYDAVGWEESADEGEGRRNLVYRAVKRLCEKQEWITSFVERRGLKTGESMWRRKEPEPEEDCANAEKAKNETKRNALNQVKRALVKLLQIIKEEKMETAIEELHRASMLLAEPFSLLTWAEAPRMSVPKMRRYGIV